MRMFSAFILVVLTGCSATGPAYQMPPKPPASYATLIIYRFANGFGGVYPIDISINAKEKVASINEQGYTVIWLVANDHEHTIRNGPTNKSWTDTVTIKPKPGNTYYVQYFASAPAGSLSAGGISSIGSRPANPFRVIPSDQALKEIVEYRLQPAVIQRID